MIADEVGGDPTTIGTGGQQLDSVAQAVGHIADGLRTAASGAADAAGHPALLDALSRFGTVASRATADLSTQLRAASHLATNAAADLAAAGGETSR